MSELPDPQLIERCAHLMVLSNRLARYMEQRGVRPSASAEWLRLHEETRRLLAELGLSPLPRDR
ncbi:MAG: hypothetical protein KGJ98_11730 [Chloroflexota bacterium]|nr:hypothetical protein [Chloroflexota bacterium]